MRVCFGVSVDVFYFLFFIFICWGRGWEGGCMLNTRVHASVYERAFALFLMKAVPNVIVWGMVCGGFFQQKAVGS